MKKLIFTILLLIVGQFIFTSCGGNSNESNKEEKVSASTTEKSKSLILDLTKVANKTEKEIELILGKAEKTEKFEGYPCEKNNCQKTFYNSEKIEIIFKEGKANRITINETADFTSDDNALENFGLENVKPTFKNPKNVIRWENIQNIAEISCFTDYVLIQVTK
ncbi:MAG: hypothetical protein CVU07_00155 [Bacteroidetes bacterium HGW-Bacteroidetes-23]|nr:MAG: hypothetical protein CVU07_00155 [Bacteroidetes bacterium HGW-Bacteroidetes-23]